MNSCWWTTLKCKCNLWSLFSYACKYYTWIYVCIFEYEKRKKVSHLFYRWSKHDHWYNVIITNHPPCIVLSSIILNWYWIYTNNNIRLAWTKRHHLNVLVVLYVVCFWLLIILCVASYQQLITSIYKVSVYNRVTIQWRI